MNSVGSQPETAPPDRKRAPLASSLRFRGAGLLIVFVAALVVRLAFVAVWPGPPGPDAPENWFPDEAEYHAIGANLASGRGFVDAYGRRASRPPGYPLFLAAAYRLAGERPGAVRTAQALLGAAACLLAAALARRFFPRPADLVCGWIAALYPFLVYCTRLLLAETLFVFLFLAGVLLLAGPWQTTARGAGTAKGWRTWAAACGGGLVLGLGILTRTSLLLLPLFAACLWVAAAKSRLQAAALAGAMVVCAGLAQTPWTARNYRTFGQFVPTTLQVGQSLYEAVGPGADGRPRMDRIDWEAAVGGRELGEFEINAFFHRKAKEHALSHPAQTARLGLVKLGRFWNPLPNAPEYRAAPFVAASLLSYVPVLLAAVAGAAAARRNWRTWLLLAAPAVYYSGLHMVFVGSVRYRTPTMPFLMGLSAWGCVWAWRRMAGHRAAPGEGAASPPV